MVTVAHSLPREGKDVSLREIAMAAEARWGLAVAVIRWRSDPPSGLPPAIIPVLNRKLERHYVAALEWRDGTVRIRDGNNEEWIRYDRLRNTGWEGEALHASTDVAAINSLRPLPWWQEPRRIIVALVCAAITLLLTITAIRRGPKNMFSERFMTR